MTDARETAVTMVSLDVNGGAAVECDAGDPVNAVALSGNAHAKRDGARGGGGAGFRIGTYARFSSTGQNEYSIERQLRNIRRYIRAFEATKVVEFNEPAKSALSIVNREELQKLLAACDRRELDIVVIEDFDRLTREIYDAVPIAERMEIAGVELHCAALGRRLSKEDIIHAAIRAENDRLRRRSITSAGRMLLAERGGVPTGRLFGYVAGTEPGFLVVDDEEAAVIRRIFDMADRGMSRRGIAKVLIAENVQGPSGRGVWATSTIQYILSQPLFAGRVVYGRTESLYDRQSHQSTLKPRPANEVVKRRVEAYRIVDDAQFLRIAARRTARAQLRKPHFESLLTERVYCDCPGGDRHPFGPTGKRLRCSRQVFYGDCQARAASLGRVEIEAAVLDAVAAKLEASGGNARLAEALSRSLARDASSRRAERKRVERRISDVDDQLDRLLARTVAKDYGKDYGKERVERLRQKLQGELSTLRDRLSALRVPDVDVELAAARLGDLGTALDRVRARLPFRPLDEGDIAFLHALRRILLRVEVRPSRSPPGRVQVAIHLDYAAHVFGVAGGAPTEVVVREVELARTKGLYVRQRADLTAFLASGAARLTDRQWAIVKDRIPDLGGRGRRADAGRREMVDLLMAHLRAGCTLHNIERASRAGNALKRFLYNGGDTILLDVLGKADPAAVAALDLRALESYRRHPLKTARGPDGHTTYTRMHALDGTTALSDAQWAVCLPCLHPSSSAGRGGHDGSMRLLLEAIMLKLRSRAPWERLPKRLGGAGAIRAATRRLVYGGSWDRLVAAWRRDCPELLDGLDVSLLDSFARGPVEWTSTRRVRQGRSTVGPSAGGRERGGRVRPRVASARRRRAPVAPPPVPASRPEC